MDAGVSCRLTGERDVAGPWAAAFVAACRFAFAFGGCLGLGVATLLLFGCLLAGALLFGCLLAGALLFGCLLAGALLFGGVLAAGVAFFGGLPRFFGAGVLCSARATSGRGLLTGFRVLLGALAVGGRGTARLPLAGAARRALAGASCPPGVV